MKIAYINASSGIAGDMILAGFVDSGISAKELESRLKKGLNFSDWKFEIRTVERDHFQAKTLNVAGDKIFDSPAEMELLIDKSKLPENVRRMSKKILTCLVEAEAKVHKLPVNKVHFHELNSIDTVIDITGCCLCLDILGINAVYSSVVNVGAAAPATLEIIKKYKVPVFISNPRNELATPTGLAIISQIAESFGDMPQMTIEDSGVGSGTKEFDGNRNFLKVLVGKAFSSSYGTDEVVLLETNIDDMDPRVYPYLMEKLFDSGVNDVWLTQVLMKKGRPGVIISIICSLEKEREISKIVFFETTTLGLRRQVLNRFVLDRKKTKDNKTALWGKKNLRVKSEYEVVKKKALKISKPLKDIMK